MTCGTGVQIRTRLCNNPPPQYNGTYCVGSDSSNITCTRAKCPPIGNCDFFQNKCRRNFRESGISRIASTSHNCLENRKKIILYCNLGIVQY